MRTFSSCFHSTGFNLRVKLDDQIIPDLAGGALQTRLCSLLKCLPLSLETSVLSSTRSSRFIEDSSALTLSVMPPKYGRSSQRQRAADARIRARLLLLESHCSQACKPLSVNRYNTAKALQHHRVHSNSLPRVRAVSPSILACPAIWSIL